MRTIRLSDEKIYIDGKAEKIVSGSIHYFRVLPEYWEDRLLKLKECGCNCVETYVCWNLHEKKEGIFDFSGWLDLGKYLETAQKLGLYAIVRPGPYICSEWDFGGMPWWLLKYREIQLRSSQPLFLEKCTPYLERVCEILRPHLWGNGGNVLFVQVENEYGSYGNDKEYLRYLQNLYKRLGIGTDGKSELITSDGDTAEMLHDGSLPDVTAAVNYRFETDDALKRLREYHKGFPLSVMELWNGISQHWREKFVRRNLDEVRDSVEKAVRQAELVNLYMFHGGTNFGFMNGMLDNGSGMIVQATSYDVDAPINEYGVRTAKYYEEQKAICGVLGKPVVNTAEDPVFARYSVRYVGETPLRGQTGLTRVTESVNLPSMEDCDQGYGYIVYETRGYADRLWKQLILPVVHDIAHVYINGRYEATVERGKESESAVNVEGRGDMLIQILVENMGRVNYGPRLKDGKGLLGDLRVGQCVLSHFRCYSLEMDRLPSVYDGKGELNAPTFYKYEFDVKEKHDTVLRPEGFTRGVAFVNGVNLGRHWTTEHSCNKLFVPAPLLKEGVNELVIFDVLTNGNKKTVTLTDDYGD